jgi:hypothetical protein
MPNNNKIYEKAIKGTKWKENIPSGHKIYWKILHSTALQNRPKLG